ncbi:MAG: hypothetical protein MJ179_11445 [Treponema sp.]|nr:hypothetical protein [Treponema sp.]
MSNHFPGAGVVLGIVITGLEVGFIQAYKAGWKVSTLATVTNGILAIALIFVGMFLYKEYISWTQVLGVFFSLIYNMYIYYFTYCKFKSIIKS